MTVDRLVADIGNALSLQRRGDGSTGHVGHPEGLFYLITDVALQALEQLASQAFNLFL